MAFTFFFRDEQILQTTADKLVENTIGRSSVRIFNAGCAMGQETYTFAIMLAERMSKFALRNIKILAVDIDNENVDFGKTLKEGIYPYEQLKRIPADLFKKYFSEINATSEYIINNELRDIIEFKKHDLLTLFPLRTDFSLVICKNVLLHFNYEQRIEVINMYHKMLLNDGLLVMENTQTMPKELESKFEKVVSFGQLYKKV